MLPGGRRQACWAAVRSCAYGAVWFAVSAVRALALSWPQACTGHGLGVGVLVLQAGDSHVGLQSRTYCVELLLLPPSRNPALHPGLCCSATTPISACRNSPGRGDCLAHRAEVVVAVPSAPRLRGSPHGRGPPAPAALPPRQCRETHGGQAGRPAGARSPSPASPPTSM